MGTLSESDLYIDITPDPYSIKYPFLDRSGRSHATVDDVREANVRLLELNFQPISTSPEIDKIMPMEFTPEPSRSITPDTIKIITLEGTKHKNYILRPDKTAE